MKMNPILKRLARRAHLLLGGGLACLSLSGCALIGDLVRSSIKDVEGVLANGTTSADLAGKKNIAVSVSAAPGGGQYPGFAFGAMGVSGGPNTAVLSDMIMRELIKLGFNARGLEYAVHDTDSEKHMQLASKKFDLAIVGNLNMGMTSSVSGALTGGEAYNSGVTSFTLKGIDIPTGDILFIISGSYGKVKPPNTVARDVAKQYAALVRGGAR